MDFISDNSIKAQFIGISNEDEIKLDVTKAFTNKSDLAALLKLDQKQLDDIELKQFNFIVKKISRIKPANLDKELFEKIYGNEIKTLKEFRAKIKEDAETNFIIESDRMFKNDIVNYMIEKL